jgi:hypothetical protein
VGIRIGRGKPRLLWSDPRNIRLGRLRHRLFWPRRPWSFWHRVPRKWISQINRFHVCSLEKKCSRANRVLDHADPHNQVKPVAKGRNRPMPCHPKMHVTQCRGTTTCTLPVPTTLALPPIRRAHKSATNIYRPMPLISSDQPRPPWHLSPLSLRPPAKFPCRPRPPNECRTPHPM